MSEIHRAALAAARNLYEELLTGSRRNFVWDNSAKEIAG